ncbi:hypothetical protein DFH07DRAFT_795025 [Mycena maculata]|uniref:Uncharacterized protein n=1 Tax=Mycena maculata TaxID=230809 RepID=A0AAD7K6X3_9AGAR|nr:hypothetical protein DFH07DRAFT_795025 [Mycena maculata]
MAPLLSVFPSTHIVGLSLAGFWLASATNISPFNMIPNLEHSKLEPATRAPLYGHLFFARGRPVFIVTALGGGAAFLAAYFTRPEDTSVLHSRALLAAAGSLLIAVPHTIVWMVPVYKALADVNVSGTEVQLKGKQTISSTVILADGRIERWEGLMRRFYIGNSIRLLFYATAYALGLYGLASAKIISVV